MKSIAVVLLGVSILVSPAAHAGAGGDGVAESGNAFGLDLYARLAAEEKGNLFLSPSSIHTALAMTYAGANGPTAEQMARTLHLAPDKDAHAAFADLMKVLNAPRTDHEGKPVYQLSIANALWGQKGYPFKPDYTALVKTNYGANLSELDFSNEAASRKTINDWVAAQTQDKIKDLITPGVIDDMTRLILTNAIYFKSNWDEKFLKDFTKDENFQVSADKTVKVAMMHREGDYGYAETDNLQMLEMPYTLNELSMLVFLPKKKDGLADFEKSLTAEHLTEWLAAIKAENVKVAFPKFKFTSQFRLADLLKAMGIPLAFDPDRADFSRMTTAEKLYISAVLHKAFVAVDEEGTEAAAATAVVMRETGIPHPPQDPKIFTADHPFAFLIRHRATGAILFLGRVADPKAE